MTEQPNLFWGARLAGQKAPRKTFPLMREVMIRMQGGCGAIVSTSTPEGSAQGQWAVETFPDFTIHFGQSRSQFLNWMQFGDVFMCRSSNETYGLAWLEMLAGGLLGVYERKWWNESQLPEWYPFVTDGETEMIEMAVVLLKQWPDGPLWKEYVPKVQEWLRTEHDENVQALRFGKVLREAHAAGLVEDESMTRSSVGDLVEQAAESLWDGSTPIPAEDLYRAINEISEANREWGKKGDMITRFYLRRCLQERGWKDTCRSAAVEFVKEQAE